jgi:DNA-binding transcriptional ArsR family regulator
MNFKSNNEDGYEEPILADSINEDQLEDASELLRAITHQLRLKILDYIDKNPHTNVNSIYNSLGLEQSITSQHLRILRVAKLVIAKRNGKQILYSLNYDKLSQINQAIQAFLNPE